MPVAPWRREGQAKSRTESCSHPQIRPSETHSSVMKTLNQSRKERVVRIVVGLVAIFLGWFVIGDELLAAVFKIFGFVPLVTGLIGWCPFYAILGISTRRRMRHR